MTKIPIKIKKALYVSEQINRYFYTTRAALDDWYKKGGLFRYDDFQSPEALYQKYKEIVFDYMTTHPDTHEVKYDFIFKRQNMRKMYGMPKGTKISFDYLVAMEKLNGKPF